MNSALYFGQVDHRRIQPHRHEFSYPLFMVYLDLSELDEVFRGRWLWSATRPAVARFRRADYLGDPQRPLHEEVRNVVEASGRPRPGGPVRMLTHLRYLGYVQNPVTFYYCFDTRDEAVDAVVAEVTNTPWGERHAYVVGAGAVTDPEELDTPPAGEAGPTTFAKAFHVSPFMPMDQRYRWAFTPPEAELGVHMENLEEGQKVFEATLRLQRREISGRSLAGALARHPWMTARVATAIYAQALRLWLKRTPFFLHPDQVES